MGAHLMLVANAIILPMTGWLADDSAGKTS
jgi:hypothetical protein